MTSDEMLIRSLKIQVNALKQGYLPEPERNAVGVLVAFALTNIRRGSAPQAVVDAVTLLQKFLAVKEATEKP